MPLSAVNFSLDELGPQPNAGISLRRLARIGVVAASTASFSCCVQTALAITSMPPLEVSGPPSDMSFQLWLTCGVGAMGMVIIGCIILSVMRTHSPKPEDVSRPIIIVTVIIAALILVTAGYNNQQIAPAFGLFGTIIGYIFGNLSRPANGLKQAESTDQPVSGKKDSSSS